MIKSSDLVRTVLCSILVVTNLVITGCAGYRPPDARNQFPIADMKAAAGRLEGMVRSIPAMEEQDIVRVMIQESGAYTFVGQGMTDFILGAGMFRLEDGHLISDTEGRRMNFSLYNRKGQTVLAGDAWDKKGNPHYVDLTRASQ